jgi:hypothetical protein
VGTAGSHGVLVVIYPRPRNQRMDIVSGKTLDVVNGQLTDSECLSKATAMTLWAQQTAVLSRESAYPIDCVSTGALVRSGGTANGQWRGAIAHIQKIPRDSRSRCHPVMARLRTHFLHNPYANGVA